MGAGSNIPSVLLGMPKFFAGGALSGAESGCRIGFHVHPHMLRHSAEHMLADEGLDTRLIQDFLGHRDIRNMIRYTKLSHHRLVSVRVR
jgi:site-specific recombinase XerD